MSNQDDFANSEVKGISRYIPTLLSKAILLILPGTAWLTFSSLREHPEWFGLKDLSWLEQTLIAALASAALCCTLVLVLVIDMAVAIHHSKHRRIVHYSNQHPQMSLRFIVQNATVYHWLLSGFICAIFFVIGCFYAKT
ncbi:hypothetical protein [uncultured Tolumonas sp.]|uniref:hypothetical protein n=1 Tax=uncultured Tolumonas sp. TaxID=263765 RepID=UPI002A0A9BDC|nr:hypothetical protein [uncultured Tolumonas sp.]